ncbi:MAG: SulP family sulfate permease [Verrucomicrobiales bacterium]|jgi:SulP family sulfate permease
MRRKLRVIRRSLFRETKSFVVDNNLDPLPLRKGFRGYSLHGLKGDARAGLNVALLAFPQGMAYATVAGLPIYYGITCSIIAAILAPFFAGSSHTILGPTNATAFMVFSYFAAHPEIAQDQVLLMPLLVLMVGLLLVFGAFLRMADMIQYISRTVVVGYIAGAALLIVANQLKHVLGVEIGPGARSFFTIAWETVQQVPNTKLAPLVIGAATCLLWFFLEKKFKALPVFAIVLVVMSVAAWLGRDTLGAVETFTSVKLNELLPSIAIFSDPRLIDYISQIAGLALAIAFLAALENSVMAKTLASRSGERPDMNQDMLSVGLANVGAAFGSGMPASGSLTRSALNFNSGATGRLASIISGLLCALGIVTLAPMIKFVPKCALAALVICIAISLINLKNIRISLAATKSDAVTLVVTFLAALLVPLHVAIFLGVGISIMLYLRKASRPQLVEYEFTEQGELTEMEGSKRRVPSISIVHVEGELFFGAAELFRTQVQRACNDENLKIIILRMKNAHRLDATSVMALEELIGFMRSKGRDLIISGATKDVYKVLKNSGLVNVIGRDNIYMGSLKTPNRSTRNALKRAQEILGTEKADIRIYYDPNQS